MSESDIPYLIALIVALTVGYAIGHFRGYAAGVTWCTKRLDEL